MKLQLLCLLALLVLVGCNDTNTAEQGIISGTPDTEGETSQDANSQPAAKPVETLAMKTDRYEIKVLNDSIKSPRKEMTGKIGNATVTVNYGSPAVKGRTVYGDLVPYGKVWRTGANEATRITFSAPVNVGEETVPAGTYSLFTSPTDKNNWTVIFNKVADQWGAYDYDENKDVAQVAAKGSVVESPTEHLEFTIAEAGLEMHWDDLVVTIPVKAAM